MKLLFIACLLFICSCGEKKENSTQKNEYFLRADSISGHIDLFDSISKKNGYSKLIELYERSIHEGLDIYIAYDFKIEAQLRIGQHLGAIKSIEEVLLRDNDRPDLILLRGVLSEYLGYAKDANIYYEKAFNHYESLVQSNSQLDKVDELNRFTTLSLYKGIDFTKDEFDKYDFDSIELREHIEIVINTERKNLIKEISNP